jgi:hypothetical protein
MYQHLESGIAFPDVVGAFQRGEPTRYPASPKEQGTAIPYQLGRTAATVFVRSATGEAATVDQMIAESISAIHDMEQADTPT